MSKLIYTICSGSDKVHLYLIMSVRYVIFGQQKLSCIYADYKVQQPNVKGINTVTYYRWVA
jgi:hypothetical protein